MSGHVTLIDEIANLHEDIDRLRKERQELIQCVLDLISEVESCEYMAGVSEKTRKSYHAMNKHKDLITRLRSEVEK